MAESQRTVVDEQTGRVFIVNAENPLDTALAGISIVYTLGTMLYLGWLLLDVNMERYSAWFLRDYAVDLKKLAPQYRELFRLVMFAGIGGGIGACVNNLRSVLHWHAELKAFGARFVWKHLAMPPLGATLALLVYALVRGGTAAVSGGFSASTNDGAIALFSAWATGALAGYGAHKVFVWLDARVNAMFKVDAKAAAAMPALIGKTPAEAGALLKAAGIAEFEFATEATTDPAKVGKVIRQEPEAGKEVQPGTKVKMATGSAAIAVPPLTGKTKDEADADLKAVKLTLGTVTEETDTANVGKVIRQDPAAGTSVAEGGAVAIVLGK